MSTLTKLSAAKLTLKELLATSCANPKCGHPLSLHPVSARTEGSACHHHQVKSHVSGDPNRARIVYCKCKSFSDPAERLPV